MHQVLHLLDRDADFQTRTLCKILAGDQAVTVGRDHLSAYRWLRTVSAPRLIHAWGWRSLIAAAAANRGPIIHTPTFPVHSGRTPWLKWICKHRNVETIFDSPELRELICMRGLSLDLCHTILPAADFTLPNRHEARRRLGLTDEDFAVLAPGESNASSGHVLALWAAAMAYEISPTWKFLAWGRGPGSARLQRQAVNMGVAPMTRFAPDLEISDFVAAADAATATADPTAGALPLSMCRAAGLPIAGKPGAKPRNISLELVKLRNDKNRQSNRNPPAQSFSADDYRRAHAELYEHLSPQSSVLGSTSLTAGSPQH